MFWVWCGSATNTAADAAVQPGRLADLTEAGAGEAFSRQEWTLVGEPNTETAAGDCLALSGIWPGCRPVGNVWGDRWDTEEEDGIEYESVCVSISDSQSMSGDQYTLKDTTVCFLDETFGHSVKVTDYFPDPKSFWKVHWVYKRLLPLTSLMKENVFVWKNTLAFSRRCSRKQQEKGAEWKYPQV